MDGAWMVHGVHARGRGHVHGMRHLVVGDLDRFVQRDDLVRVNEGGT